MASQGYKQPDIKTILLTIPLVSLALVLPGIQWSLFGWLYSLLPLIGLFVLGRFGDIAGKKLLLTSAGLAFAGNMIGGSVNLFLFSCTMLFPGFVLHRSAMRGESPALSGLKGCLSLVAGWLLFVFVSSVGSDVSAYSQLLNNLDQALAQALLQYQQTSGIEPDTLAVIEATIVQMRMIIPAIMPGIAGSVVLFVIWTTMAAGNQVLGKTTDLAPWPSFRLWVLPEKLVWAVIAMGGFILIPIEPLPKVGINCILLLSVIYCFQGLSITVFYMNKWKVPLILRSFFYVMIVFQSLGTLVLLLLGIADSWFDFRKLKAPEATETNNGIH